MATNTNSNKNRIKVKRLAIAASSDLKQEMLRLHHLFVNTDFTAMDRTETISIRL